MQQSKIISQLFKSIVPTRSIATISCSYFKAFSTSRRLTMLPRYNFGSGKQEQNSDFSKNKVQGKLSGDKYESIQLKTACLGLFSYIIHSEGEAVVIDPLNEIDQYEKILKEKNLKLKYVFLTHFHADFISGQLDLLKKFPNTKIVMGPNAKTDAYKIQILNQGESIKLGSILLEALHTPGHTLESTCFILKTKDGHPQAIYTGDTVFIGEVGRPDLAAKANIKPEQLAKKLFSSIQKIKKLPNDLTVYPNHGQGSSCGKSIGKGDKTTIGCEKQKNYAFKAQTESAFVEAVLKDMPTPPGYYFSSVSTNKSHPFDFEQTFKKVFKPLTPQQFQQQMKKPQTYVLDVRSENQQFFKGIIKGSYFVGNGGPLANYIGSLFKVDDAFLIFGNETQAQQAIKRLQRIGYLNIKGYSNFSFSDWKGESIKYQKGTFEDLQNVIAGKSDYTILDLRTAPELEKEGVFMGNNVNSPIQTLRQTIQKGGLKKDKKYLIHCASGYRAKIAATILQQKNYEFKVIVDSWKQNKQKGAKVVQKH